MLIVGAPGSGKTFALQAIERAARTGPPRQGYHRPRFVIHDLMGHWSPAPGRTIVVSDEPEEACAAAIDLAPCTLVMDEIALGLPSDSPPKKGSAMKEILFVGRQARHVGRWKRRGPVGLLAAAQRPATVHPSLRGLLNRLYVGHFPPTAVNDLEWIEKATSPDVAARVPTLRFGEFIALELNP